MDKKNCLMQDEHEHDNHNDEKASFPKGLKWTKQRKAVYQVLKDAEEPMSAVEIYHKVIETDQTAEYAVSTIYRILATFEENEMLIKSTFMNEETYVYELNRGMHTHYAVCMKCHKKVVLDGCPFMSMRLPKAQDDFQITGHKLELYGYCKDCKE